jgi:hypothetical protein
MRTGTVITNTHSDLTTWTAPTPRPTVAVTRMKVDLKCMVCGKTWGLWVLNEALPPAWDKCRECEQKRIQENNRQIEQSYRADISGRRKEL